MYRAMVTAITVTLFLAPSLVVPMSDPLTAHAAAMAVTGVQVVAEECEIRIGGGGKTYTYRQALNPGEERSWNQVVEAVSFIRSTRGPCHFTVYNGSNLTGRYVILGSNLGERIRAGIDGVRYKDDGGGKTWRIRSLKMQRVSDTSCRLAIGGGGVRMDYYRPAEVVPAMDRIGGFFGGDCRARIWSTSRYGQDDPHNRFKYLHPSGPRKTAYDPGFRVRSIWISNERGICREPAKDQGRCLPQYQLPASIYAVSTLHPDKDRDGLVDALENSLAEAFRPIYVNDSGENATRIEAYHAAPRGEPVIEPVTIFQVRPHYANQIVIVFMKLWLWDRGVVTCEGHKGDSQWISVYLRTVENSPDRGTFWYVYKTSGGAVGDLDWEQGNGSIRGVTFEGWAGEPGANHVVQYFSKGKHHEYADGGWSGQTDKICAPFVDASVDGRGHLHDPPYPKRIAIIRAPLGHSLGDDYGYTNVGSQRVHFFDDLTPYGFPGQRVWSGRDFYEADSVDRAFE